VLYTGSAVISKVAIVRTLEELNKPHPEFEMLITNVADNFHPIAKDDYRGKEFVILQTNQVFEANGLVAIPFKRAATRIRSLAPGSYLVQVRTDRWPESSKLGALLRDRWKRSGYLAESVTTPVSGSCPKPNMVSCE
jgi:hypothetical protein